MRLLIVSICLLWAGLTVSAQKVVLKTNLIHDVTATANVAAEFKVAPKWTVDISGDLNAWTFSDNKKWKHWKLQPEARYWLCETFNGHFVGAHLLGGIYNMGNWNTGFTFLGTDFGQLKDYRYEGWMVGAGMAYGYHWMLGRHWSVEAEIGLGYVYSRADKYECPRCGDQLEDNKPHHYVGLTKVAVNLVYVF